MAVADNQTTATVKDPKTFAVASIVLHALVIISTYSANITGILGPKGALYVAIALPLVNIAIQLIKQRFPGIDAGADASQP